MKGSVELGRSRCWRGWTTMLLLPSRFGVFPATSLRAALKALGVNKYRLKMRPKQLVAKL